MSMDRLTEQEREFAARWHGVIYAFLNRNRLPEAEYYARDSIMELVQWDEFCGLMRQVMPVLTVRQQGQLALMLEGYTMREIVKRQHKSIRDYYGDLKKIRETVASVTGCGYHGENCTGATGTVSGKTGGVR